MRHSWVPVSSFALAIAISVVAAPPLALGRRARQDNSNCSATATAKSVTAKVQKYDVLYQDLQVQVDASDSSVLKVHATFGLRGSADVSYPPPKAGHVFGLFWETDLAPAAQTKDYQGPVSKLEKNFTAFGAKAETVLSGSKRSLARWRKERPEDFEGVTGIQIVIPAQKADLAIKGTFVCKKNGQGTFNPLFGDVPVDKDGTGGATVSQ